MSDPPPNDIRQQEKLTDLSNASVFAFDRDPPAGRDLEADDGLTIEGRPDQSTLPATAEVIAHPALATLARRGMLLSHSLSPGQARAKRLVDVIGSLVALGVLAPLLLTIAGLLAMRGGPVMFTQDRIGERGRIFRCYKFRTMRVGAERMLADVLERDDRALREWLETRKLTNDPRVTRLGGFLRRTSLDELPQLLNVLKGDMSLVGPRPIVWREVSRYRGFIRYYLSVKPGLTGLWQVSGRNHTTYPRRVALDRAYVRKYSLGLDVAILVRTIPALVRREGAY